MTRQLTGTDRTIGEAAPAPASVNARPVRHLDQTELARRWRMSPRTLERWRFEGQGPAFLKLGGRVAYRLADIEAFEAAQLRIATPDSVQRHVEAITAPMAPMPMHLTAR